MGGREFDGCSSRLQDLCSQFCQSQGFWLQLNISRAGVYTCTPPREFRNAEVKLAGLQGVQPCSDIKQPELRHWGLTCRNSARTVPTPLPSALQRVPKLPAALILRITKASRLAITFLVQNGDAYLDRTMRGLFALGSAFAEFRVYFVENDSRDSTRNILGDWLARYPALVHGCFLDDVSNEARTSLPKPSLCQSTHSNALASHHCVSTCACSGAYVREPYCEGPV